MAHNKPHIAPDKVDRIAPFPLRYADRPDEDLEAIERAFRLDTLSGESELVGQYEEALCAHFKVKNAIAVNSGSSALHSSLSAIGVVSGSEVLVPAAAPLPTLFPILTIGAVPVFVDTACSSLGFDIDDLENKITKRTRAALAVHLWGYPVDLSECIALLDSRGIPLIEDACQAHGASIGGSYVGTFGRMGCFSTHEYKCISTGEGGFVLTNDRALADSVKKMARLGFLDGEHYGYNFKLSGIAASLGICRLRRLSQRLDINTRNAHKIIANLCSDRIRELPVPPTSIPNYYSLVMCLDLAKGALGKALAECVSRGIPTDRSAFGYDIAYRRPIFGNHPHDCLNAENLVDSAIQIPCHPGISASDATEMAEILNEIMSRFASGGDHS